MRKSGYRRYRYGKSEQANALGYRISEQLAAFVENTPVKYGWKQRAMLHAQSGISSDVGTTPGARLPYGDEPDPITHLLYRGAASPALLRRDQRHSNAG